MKFDFEILLTLLGTIATDPKLIRSLDSRPDMIRRIGAQGFLALKEEGFSAVFQDLSQGAPSQTPEMLILGGFHFYRGGHGGYKQYQGTFPNQIYFNDTEPTVLEKFGQPQARGGGGVSDVLKTPIPHWVRYFYKTAALTLQFDARGTVEMISLFDPNVYPSIVSRQQ